MNSYYLILPIFISLMMQCAQDNNKPEIYGHRGCRGLLPENSIPGFIEALKLGSDALELDLVVSNDDVLVVSHEPWFSHEICVKPDGSRIKKEEEKELNIYKMTYDEVKAYSFGVFVHPDFPEQEMVKVHKPDLAEVFDAVGVFCRSEDRQLPKFNIEIKYGEKGDFFPGREKFVDLLYDVVKEYEYQEMVILQSFDLEILRIARRKYPTLKIALLNGKMKSGKKMVKELGFKPEFYSPHYRLVNRKLMDWAGGQGLKVVPWTVNDEDDIRAMIEMGVDGIISDFPDRVAGILNSAELK